MPISYNFSGKDSDNRKLFHRFSLDDLLLYTANFSTDLLMDPSSAIRRSIRNVKYPLINAQTKERLSQRNIVTGWDLIDLSYYAISATNDFRGKAIESIDEFYLLHSAIRASLELREDSYLNDGQSVGADFLLRMWGFGGEQFKFQSIANCFENFARDLYLLINVSPRIKGITNIHDIIFEEAGVDWITITTSLLLAWVGTSKKMDIATLENSIIWDKTISRDQFFSVINRYTVDYSQVRSSCLGRQIFYTKPFIKTERHKKIFCVNSFLGLFLLEHSLLWIIRDYYKARGDQKFTSEFGIIFEAYLGEVFSKYLDPSSYNRIPPSSPKHHEERADWKLNVGNYRFLVEQKSASLSLAAKQQDSNLESIKTFAKKNIFKAMSQLYATEKAINNGKYIKVILLYEDYLVPESIYALFDLPDCPVINDNYYWIMTIDEMEVLLTLYNENHLLFEKVIREKEACETCCPRDGKSIKKILAENGITHNKHIDSPQMEQYRKAVFQNAQRHIKDENRHRDH